METAWIYCAVSSRAQEDDLRDHEQWARETADEHGWLIERTFGADARGVGSGKHGVREVLDDLLTELRATPKARRPKRIILSRIDRLGRGDALDVIAAVAELRKLGVTLHTRTDGDLTLTSVKGTLKTVLDAIAGGLENEAKSDRAKAGHAKRRRAGKHAGHAPYGTVLIDGIPTAYEPEAAIVREVFDRYLNGGWGRLRIAREIGPKAPAKRRADGSLRRISWSASTIEGLLKRATLRGVVVDPDTFDAVQATFRAREGTCRYTRGVHGTFPLRGILRCSCGRALTVQRSGSKRVRYYVCRHLATHEHYVLHRADVMETQFEALLRRLVADPAFIYREPAPSVDAITERKRALLDELQRLDTGKRRLYELAEQGFITGAEIRERFEQTATERKRLETLLIAADADLAAARTANMAMDGAQAVLGALADAWPHASDEDRHEVARAVAQVVMGLHCDPEHKGVLTVGVDRFSNYKNCTQLYTFANRLSAFVDLLSLAPR